MEFVGARSLPGLVSGLEREAPKTDVAASKRRTRGAVLGGLRSGKLEEAVLKMEDDVAAEEAAGAGEEEFEQDRVREELAALEMERAAMEMQRQYRGVLARRTVSDQLQQRQAEVEVAHAAVDEEEARAAAARMAAEDAEARVVAAHAAAEEEEAKFLAIRAAAEEEEAKAAVARVVAEEERTNAAAARVVAEKERAIAATARAQADEERRAVTAVQAQAAMVEMAPKASSGSCGFVATNAAEDAALLQMPWAWLRDGRCEYFSQIPVARPCDFLTVTPPSSPQRWRRAAARSIGGDRYAGWHPISSTGANGQRRG